MGGGGGSRKMDAILRVSDIRSWVCNKCYLNFYFETFLQSDESIAKIEAALRQFRDAKLANRDSDAEAIERANARAFNRLKNAFEDRIPEIQGLRRVRVTNDLLIHILLGDKV